MGRGIPSRKDPRRKRIREDKREKKGRRRTGNNRGPDIARDVSRYCSSIVRSSFIIFVSATTTGTRNIEMPFPAPESSGGGYVVRKEKERNWFPKVN